MSGFRITKAAEQDLVNIAQYTLETWGEEQCVRYIEEFDAAFERLAEVPTRGKPCDHIRSGYFRYQQGKHMILYRESTRRSKFRILIVRILHERMLPERHL